MRRIRSSTASQQSFVCGDAGSPSGLWRTGQRTVPGKARHLHLSNCTPPAPAQGRASGLDGESRTFFFLKRYGKRAGASPRCKPTHPAAEPSAAARPRFPLVRREAPAGFLFSENLFVWVGRALVARGAGVDTVEPLLVCRERVPVHGSAALAIAATPVFHHQHQAWGGWPAARLTAPCGVRPLPGSQSKCNEISRSSGR